MSSFFDELPSDGEIITIVLHGKILRVRMHAISLTSSRDDFGGGTVACRIDGVLVSSEQRPDVVSAAVKAIDEALQMPAIDRRARLIEFEDSGL